MEKVFNTACFMCLVILTECLAAGAILHLFAGNYGWSATQTAMFYVAFRCADSVHKEMKGEQGND